MITVWKEVIEPDSLAGEQFVIPVQVTKSSRFLSVALQDGNCCVWFTSDTKSRAIVRLDLICVGTGHGAVPEDYVFLGTVVQNEYVWHFFCKKVDSYASNP